ncbi:MAG: protein kinase [Planctomycetaceae bacterium]|nr:protein kinase [Planctomycetaceae bacterium]
MASKKKQCNWRQGAVICEAYKLVKKLGENGVWLAKGRFLRSSYAVKRVRWGDEDPEQEWSDEDREEQDQWRRELVAWTGLPAHPCIAPLYFLRSDRGERVLFSEFVAGGDLSQWISKGLLYEGPCEKAVGRIMGVAYQISVGLKIIHEAGLKHLDIKPKNILMDGRQRRLVARITDFGNSQTQRIRGDKFYLRGTPPYESPEQKSEDRRRRISAKTDIYSWAVMVLEMFRGECPSENPRKAMRKYRCEGKSPMISDKLAGILERSLRDNPVDRPESSEIADSLEPEVPREFLVEGPPVAPTLSTDKVSWRQPTDFVRTYLPGQERTIRFIEGFAGQRNNGRHGTLNPRHRGALDLANYEIIEGAWEDGRPQAFPDFRRELLLNTANLLGFLGDFSGMLARISEITDLEAPGNQLDRDLARAWIAKAVMSGFGGDLPAAIEGCERARQFLGGDRALGPIAYLVALLLTEAAVQQSKAQERCGQLREILGGADDLFRSKDLLADVDLVEARSLASKKLPQATGVYRRLVAYWEDRTQGRNRPPEGVDISCSAALAYSRVGLAKTLLQACPAEALMHASTGADALKNIVSAGRVEYQDWLNESRLVEGTSLLLQGNPDDARVPLQESACEREKLLTERGITLPVLTNDIAASHVALAICLRGLGEAKKSIAACEKIRRIAHSFAPIVERIIARRGCDDAPLEWAGEARDFVGMSLAAWPETSLSDVAWRVIRILAEAEERYCAAQ